MMVMQKIQYSTQKAMKSSTAFRRETAYQPKDLIFNFIIVKKAELQTHIAVQQPGKEKGTVSFSLMRYIYPVFYESKEKEKLHGNFSC